MKYVVKITRVCRVEYESFERVERELKHDERTLYAS